MANRPRDLTLDTYSSECPIDSNNDFINDPNKMEISPRTTAPLFASEPGRYTLDGLEKAMNEDADAQAELLTAIMETLNEIVQRNDALQVTTQLVSFTGPRILLSAAEYVKRIVKYSGATPTCFLVGLIYLERLKQREPSLCLTSRTLQRLLLIAVMEGCKFVEDAFLTNTRWAQIGGLTVQELNALELEFLFRTGFRLMIQREEYDMHAWALLARARNTTSTATATAPTPAHCTAPAAAAAADESAGRHDTAAAAPVTTTAATGHERACGVAAAAATEVCASKVTCHAEAAGGGRVEGPHLFGEWAGRPCVPCGPAPTAGFSHLRPQLRYV